MYKVLLIDFYDSYTYNLYQLILNVIPDAQVVVVRSDLFDVGIIDAFHFIVIGPGPGNPCNTSDIGCAREVFKYDVPILGVCLGFQLICLQYGASIRRLQTPKHGQVSQLLTSTCPIYPSGTNIQVTRYHSLTANLAHCHDIKEIGWVEDIDDNGHVSMAVMHNTKPFIGVQYHPESACSTGGEDLVRNFLSIADRHNKNRVVEARDIAGLTVQPRPLLFSQARASKPIAWEVLDLVLPAPRIAEILKVDQAERAIVLDSAASPSRFAIIAAIDTSDKHFSYVVGQPYCIYGQRQISLEYCDVWQAIAQIMDENKVMRGPKEIPFWGGLAGYVSYESGCESLGVSPTTSTTPAADINLIMVTRSIVIDYDAGSTHIVSLRDGDRDWLRYVAERLRRAVQTPPTTPPSLPVPNKVTVVMPDKATYLANIAKAQQYLAEGQSYELCLTAATKITCNVPRQPWDLYQTLRRRNPSPFACYMKLPGVNLLSSSPERFLSWTADGHCQLRPIKGTVRKSSTMTKDQAATLLRDPKEFAENLMIVDLIRHDLHQIAHNVCVPSLMVVEEYETVYQLVSVITGQVLSPYTGLDALSHALPPGSMTGAPKKRSVELLQGLEQRRRGLYSGVCGYLSVCGGGDWSVIIRTAFRYDSENQVSTEPETWWIGAGGAITALSGPEAEWEEMLAKLQSTLPAFLRSA